MKLLRAILAGFFVVLVALCTAAVIAVSAAVVFIARRLSGGASGEAGCEASQAEGEPRPRRMAGGDVIDVDATELPASTPGR